MRALTSTIATAAVLAAAVAGAPLAQAGSAGAGSAPAGRLPVAGHGQLAPGDELRSVPAAESPVRPRAGALAPYVRGAAGHDLRGLASSAGNALRYTYDATARQLLGVDRTGRVAERYDLAPLRLRGVDGLALAPSADATDDPSAQSLYVSEAATPTTARQVVEVQLGATDVVALAAVADVTLIRSVPTSAYSPPSPDPSGVTFAPGSDRLVIVDGEVEEMSIFAGANLWATSRSGVVQTTGVTQPWSDEPTGAGFNPANNHLFVSDDSAKEVFEVAAGSDGRYGTSDDTVTSFDTTVVGNNDTEGVEYDPATGSVWTVDGVNTQVYRFQPGNDGRFGTSDDVRSNFDVGGYGADDPEGIAYDAARDTLLVLDDGSNTIYELDRSGTLLNTISTASLGMDAAAGITVAPRSTDPSQRSYYLVARGQDNNDNSRENDGMLYEVAAALPGTGGGGPGNLAPSVDAGADQAVTLPASASLDATVTDDGLPDPPGAVTTTWSVVSGPGAVTFGNVAAVDTTASFSTAGSYVLRLTASDGLATTTDDVGVAVAAVGGGVVVERAVQTGSDDVEQSASGSVNLSSSDLELVTDGSTVQRVGTRFAGLQVPKGATVTAAWVQFRADEVTTAATSLTIRAEAADNTPTYTSTSNNVSGRAVTTQSVSWAPAAWSTVNQVGTAQRTPDLSALVQAVVSRPGWAQGNALAMQFTGTGRRTADAFEGGFGPVLHVEYTTGPVGPPVNTAPVVNAGSDQSVTLPGTGSVQASLDATVTDDGLPVPPGAVSATWSVVSGPGAVTFGSTSSVDTTASFTTAGSYVLQLAASDGALGASDQVTITVNPPVGPPVNQAPVVNAGSDQSVTLPATGSVQASLDATVTDDGLPVPPGAVSATWSVVSGPGAVTFASTSSVDTTASFTTAGSYVLQLAASDGVLGASDQVTVTVTAAGTTVLTANIPVRAGSDDAEQRYNGEVLLTSSDLDLTTDGSRFMSAVGLRFTALPVPRGAVVTNAYIQFAVDEAGSGTASLTLRAQAADNAPTFTTAASSLTARATTSASAAWAPEAWTTVGLAGPAQRTSDLSALVNEVVGRPGWAQGNALVLLVTGTANRTAQAFEGKIDPVLHLEWRQ